MSIEIPYHFTAGRRIEPDWFSSARLRNKQKPKQPRDQFPFPNFLEERKFLGEGEEQIVYGFPQGSVLHGRVVKESKQEIPFRYQVLATLAMGEGCANFLSWKEMAANNQHGYNIMAQILGYNLPKTQYLHSYASDGSGRTVNYCIQEEIHGRKMRDGFEENMKQINNDPDKRRQAMRIVWGSKKIFQVLGAPPDFDLGNNILLENDGRILLSDPGFPGFVVGIVYSDVFPLLSKQFAEEWMTTNLKYIDMLEQRLEPSRDEIVSLNMEFGIDCDGYVQQLRKLEQRKKELSMKRAVYGTVKMHLAKLIKSIRMPQPASMSSEM